MSFSGRIDGEDQKIRWESFRQFIIRQCLLHRLGFRHLIAAAPAVPVISFCCSIFTISQAGIAARTQGPNSNRKILEKKKELCCELALLTVNTVSGKCVRIRYPEVESRTQGSRPRTQKKSEAKAKDSPSEDRTSRGQGQECSRPRPRTKDTGASVLQKKSLQKFFSGDLQFVGVPRIYWDKPKPQIEWNDVIKIFPKRKFLWDKLIVGWKIWYRCPLARNQDFAKG